MMRNRKARVPATVRVFWLCSLCLYLAGCAGTYERIPLQAATTDVDQQSADPMSLKIGDRIRISDDHGRRVEGIYGGIRGNKLVLVEAEMVYTPEEKFSEFSESETVRYDQTSEFSLADITVLEKYPPHTGITVLASGLFVLGSLVYLFFYAGN
jgi:hypothetical protein